METNFIDTVKSNYEFKIPFIFIIIAMMASLLHSGTLEDLKAKVQKAKKYDNSQVQAKMKERLKHSKTFRATSNIGKKMKNRVYVKAYTEAKHNNANAQFALGSMYYQGINVKKDYKKAIEQYRKAAMQGHTKAQFNLAYMYFDARGTEKNHNEALKWFLKAGEAKDGKAELYLGLIYKEKNNHQKAFYWYTEAAKEGYPKAQYELAKMYYAGKGCKRDLKKYIYYLKKAAIQSEAHAEYNLGIAYLKGEGVTKDKNKARKWLQKAHLDGDTGAIKVLHKLKKDKK